MRTDGTMKVTVFEAHLGSDTASEAMLAYATLLSEAAEWLRAEHIRDVFISPNRQEAHRLYNVSLDLVCTPADDENGAVAQLFVHYDDNEVEK